MPAAEIYTPRLASRSEWLDARGLRLHVRRWGRAGAPRLFLIHGWMDVAASFQFMIDALAGDWDVIAPDLRGFGDSEWNRNGYFFAQYLADLDLLLDHYSPDEPVRLVGHSLGGNVVTVYAGVRPERIRALVALDTFGLRDAAPDEAPQRLAQWLAQQRRPETFRPMADFKALAQRLAVENPRLSSARAAFLARQLGEEDGIGGVVRAADPTHKHINPNLYRFSEIAACWRRVRAPVLQILADDRALLERLGVQAEDVEERMALFEDVRCITFDGCGHNLHHDDPERLAQVIEDFLAQH
ncbi:alpha/beta hydrolase [Niveibacterium sp. SC-1]|uniref:alpha/beta fold hydrolase n=1 Tax=Niveibacterium sp. SC-1 TaxID=3135646 RepID=UPI00311D3620